MNGAGNHNGAPIGTSYISYSNGRHLDLQQHNNNHHTFFPQGYSNASFNGNHTNSLIGSSSSISPLPAASSSPASAASIRSPSAAPPLSVPSSSAVPASSSLLSLSSSSSSSSSLSSSSLSSSSLALSSSSPFFLHDPSLFLSSASSLQSFICSCCSHIFRVPVSAHNASLNNSNDRPCFHTFCNHCILEWTQRFLSCPECLKPLHRNQLKQNKDVADKIAVLKVKCPSRKTNGGNRVGEMLTGKGGLEAGEVIPDPDADLSSSLSSSSPLPVASSSSLLSPSSLCSWTGDFGIEGSNLYSHLSSCPHCSLRCAYHHLGCEYKCLTSQELAAHHVTNVENHLELAMQVIGEKQKKIEELEEEKKIWRSNEEAMLEKQQQVEQLEQGQETEEETQTDYVQAEEQEVQADPEAVTSEGQAEAEIAEEEIQQSDEAEVQPEASALEESDDSIGVQVNSAPSSTASLCGSEDHPSPVLSNFSGTSSSSASSSPAVSAVSTPADLVSSTVTTTNSTTPSSSPVTESSSSASSTSSFTLPTTLLDSDTVQLYLNNMPFDTTGEELHDWLSEGLGLDSDSPLIRVRMPDPFRGFAFALIYRGLLDWALELNGWELRGRKCEG